MPGELTFWITPFTTLRSLGNAISTARRLTPSGFHPNLLLPTHFGPWPQSECRQTLPADMLVASPDDVGPIRELVEKGGLGFGCWGVPVDQRSAGLAAGFAAAGGYYSANFEPAEFWLPGDDPASVDAWWEEFWNTLPEPDALSGNVSATVVPNAWGLGAFRESLPNLAGGCGTLVLETYGGPNTRRSYPYPNLWPTPSLELVRETGVEATLVPIIALANRALQLDTATDLGGGQCQVWCL